MVTARPNTEASRIVYYEGGLYGPFLFWRWVVLPSGSRLPLYAYPDIAEEAEFVVHYVRLTDAPAYASELPNLPNGQHALTVEGSNDGAIWVPLYADILNVAAPEVAEPIAI